MIGKNTSISADSSARDICGEDIAEIEGLKSRTLKFKIIV